MTTPISPYADWEPCADCASRVDPDGVLRHAESCPISRGVEAACADDAAYFLANPTESERVREMTEAERQSFAHADPRYGHPIFKTHGCVFVTQLEPGIRTRQPLCIVPNTEGTAS